MPVSCGEITNTAECTLASFTTLLRLVLRISTFLGENRQGEVTRINVEFSTGARERVKEITVGNEQFPNDRWNFHQIYL